MDYHAVQQIIFSYADEKAPDFADRFCRFPCNPIAADISAFLRMRAAIYEKIDEAVFHSIHDAADEIDRSAEY